MSYDSLEGTPKSLWDYRPGVSSFVGFLCALETRLHIEGEVSLRATLSGEV